MNFEQWWERATHHLWVDESKKALALLAWQAAEQAQREKDAAIAENHLPDLGHGRLIAQRIREQGAGT
jgi:hypothetical protein